MGEEEEGQATPGRGQDTPGYLAPGGQAAPVVWGWGKINCYTAKT